MFRLHPETMRTMLAIHGWSGLVLGLLLYAVIATGAAAVFAHEIGTWAAPRVPTAPAADLRGLGDAIEREASAIDPAYHDEIVAFPAAGGALRVFFHRHAKGADGTTTEEGVELDLDPASWLVLRRRAGTAEQIAEDNPLDALERFLVDLHVRLHVPMPWGTLLTGVLGLAMMVAAVTGVVIHRHLIRDLFTQRRRAGRLLRARDAHASAATWCLPFAFALAFTGGFYSFAGAFGLQAMALVAFGGDQEALVETVIGNPVPEDSTPARGAALESVLTDAATRSARPIQSLSITHYGRADAVVVVAAEPAPGRLAAPTLVYRGQSGEFLQEKPAIGLQASLGDDLIALMAALHFGAFAGVVSKSLWFALGFACAYVVSSGLRVWTVRRADDTGWSRLSTAVAWMSYGLPWALSAAAAGHFIWAIVDRPSIHGAPNAFLAAVSIATVCAFIVRNPAQLRRVLLTLNGVTMVGLPALRILAGGPRWGLHSSDTVLTLDLALLTAGAVTLVSVFRTVRRVAGRVQSATSGDSGIAS
jgi:uncharacterized iron-regulated membrane protein